MLSLFFVTLVMTTRGQINIADYQCTMNNECGGLQAVIDAKTGGLIPITAVCNTDDNFCSIDCSGANNGMCTLAAQAGLKGLSCDKAKGWCTADLSCKNNEDCVVTGFGTCTSVGKCIPDASNECSQLSDCTTDGLKNCDTLTVQGVNVTFCQSEPCDATNNLGKTTGCVTANYVCGERNVCVEQCTDNPSCNKDVDLGSICNAEKVCVTPTQAPTAATKDPTQGPTDNPTPAPTDNPTADTSSNGDGTHKNKNGIANYEVFGGFMIMLGIILRM